ncbi:MAG: hypothetical protein PUH24_04795 [Prevotellaceae bacterium]|nr:hypothetical protein [Prevotella sp.]MDD7257580.1 hypothetical protein [Prevotellaceae bacterium]MDY6130946.1 hypothetical protein [Prevotella sp.]
MPWISVSQIPVFTDYIYLRQGLGYIDRSRSHSVSGNINYKHVTKGIFGMAMTG